MGTFYCATIAYHVGLNALLVAARNYDQRLRKKTFILGRSLRLSSHNLPLMLQLFSLVATILQSLVWEVFTAVFYLYLSAVLLLYVPFYVFHLLLYIAHSGQFSALPLLSLILSFVSSPRLAFLLRVFNRGYTRVCFIACKTWHPTKLVEINLAQQNVIISAIHLTHTTSALPAEKQVRATIRV